MADRLKTLQEQKKDLEAQTKALGAEIAELDEQLSDAMTEAELDRFSRNGSTFYLKSRLFASPASDRKDEMMQALKDNGYGSLVVETVNANTLASFIKEQREATGEDVPAWLGDTVSTYEKVSASESRRNTDSLHQRKIYNLFHFIGRHRSCQIRRTLRSQ